MSAVTVPVDFLVAGAIPTATKQILQATASTGATGTAQWVSGSSAHETPLTVGGTGVAFANSWVNFGAPTESTSYFKDPFGIVHLRGAAKSGTVGAAIFTLPAGYRPANQRYFAVISNSLFGYLYVNSSGNVVLSSGSNASVTFDGVHFDV